MQAQSGKIWSAGRDQPVLFWSGVVLLLVLLGCMLLPTLNLGFVADDFFLLVPDVRLPVTQSVDDLHRPLRNVTLRLIASRIGIQHVLPYRLLVAASFAAALALLFQLTRRLGANRFGALAAVFVLAFCPRNHEVLYWFAAWQDLVAAVAVLFACLFFLDFRETDRPFCLGLAAIAYLVALGFKETTAVLPALLVSIDFYRERSTSSFWRRPFWKAYLPFAGILLLYTIYFFWQSGFASLAGRRAGGYYGFHGFAGVLPGVVRALINIALPFSTGLGLKDIRLWHVAVLLLESGVLLLLVWRLQLWPALILSASWLICTLLPTVAFAVFNADRYLFVPMLGEAIFVGLLMHALVMSPRGRKYSIAAFIALALYTSAGISQLMISREQWRKAGMEVALVIRETMRLCPILPEGSEVDVVNITYALHPRGAVLSAVFENGLSEALHANGFSSSARILRNFSTPDSEQEGLVNELQKCANLAAGALTKRIILIEVGGQVRKLDTPCAASLVDSDRAQRPSAWSLLYSGQSFASRFR